MIVKETVLSEAFMENPMLIPVAERLGVPLGYGRSTVDEACRKEGRDVAFFLAMVNTFSDGNYFPKLTAADFPLAKTADYLEATARHFEKVQLPNIRRHLESMRRLNPVGNNLAVLTAYFEDTASGIVELCKHDCASLYPELRNGMIPDTLRQSVMRHEESAERLHDLLRLFVSQISGDFDSNLATAVATAISSMDRDYRQNNRIRRRFLLPMSESI